MGLLAVAPVVEVVCGISHALPVFGNTLLNPHELDAYGRHESVVHEFGRRLVLVNVIQVVSPMSVVRVLPLTYLLWFPA